MLNHLQRYFPPDETFDQPFGFRFLPTDSVIQSEAEEFFELLSKHLSGLQELALIGQLGLKLGDFLEFRSLSPEVRLQRVGTRYTTWYSSSWNVDNKEAAQFCLRFATDLAIAIERALGSLPETETKRTEQWQRYLMELQEKQREQAEQSNKKGSSE